MIKNRILILSGKGGVGKSTVTTSLATTLVNMGYRVGILDIDLTGPSLPTIFNMKDHKIHQSEAGWIPCYVDDDQKLGIVSLGFLLPSDDNPVLWRGPKKNAMIEQFVNDIYWGDLDFLLIDTPPGTSDEHISIAGFLRGQIKGAILVTTPQSVSLIDVRREYSFCKKLEIPVLGLVENMSGFVCEHCRECTNIFSQGGGEQFSKDNNIDFLGMVPIDPMFTQLIDNGEFYANFKDSGLYAPYSQIADLVLKQINRDAHLI